MNKILKKIKNSSSYKFISHIPEAILSSIPNKNLQNFIAATEEEDRKEIYLQSLPYHYVIEPTNSCNLRCPLCSTGSGNKSRDKGIIKIEKYKKILDKISDSVLEIYFQNWGEPTLVKYLPEMIAMTKDLNIYTNLSTNFSIEYKDDFLERLMMSGLTTLHVDVDGTTQDVYEIYRKKGNLKIVIDNLKKVIDIKLKKKLKFPLIETNMLVMKQNEHQIDDFINLNLKIGTDKYSLGKIQIDPNSDVSKSFLPKNNAYIYNTYQSQKKEVNPCHWPWSGMVINWDGNITACCIVDDPNSDFGNILEGDLLDIWNNQSYISSRAEFSDKTKIIKHTICNICKNNTHSINLNRIKNTFSITS